MVCMCAPAVERPLSNSGVVRSRLFTTSPRAQKPSASSAMSSNGLYKLLVITPSRGRPASLRRLAEKCAATCEMDTTIAVGLDEDDPALDGYKDAKDWPRIGPVFRGPRKSLTGWTNTIARLFLPDYDFFASVGDDHVPSTQGWDVKLTGAIQDMGGTGFAYGDDKIMGQDVPTAWVVSADIVRALNWICLPVCGHFCVDNAVRDLGEGADCLAYLPSVLMEHKHPAAGRAEWDQTYADTGGFSPQHPDFADYLRWQREQMTTDIATVRALMV